jgi:hypothetical protein
MIATVTRVRYPYPVSRPNSGRYEPPVVEDSVSVNTRTRGSRSTAALWLAELALLVAALAVLAVPRTAAAQDGFLFSAPQAGLTLRAGPMLYSARGDVFEAMRKDLTLERGDFRGPSVGLDIVITPLSRWDLVLGVGYSESSAGSEFREWVDQDDLPIEQTTRLRVIPATATLRYLPLSRGRSISSVAWLPRATTPYVGAGGGVVWYRLRQTGEFVNFMDYRIFSDVIEAYGWRGVVHGVAGVDHWFTPRLGLNAEVRYNHGGADPQQGFRSFDRLDLGGAQATLGFSVRW